MLGRKNIRYEGSTALSVLQTGRTWCLRRLSGHGSPWKGLWQKDPPVFHPDQPGSLGALLTMDKKDF